MFPPSESFLQIFFYHKSVVHRKFQPKWGGCRFHRIWLWIKGQQLDLETPIFHPYLKMDKLVKTGCKNIGTHILRFLVPTPGLPFQMRSFLWKCFVNGNLLDKSVTNSHIGGASGLWSCIFLNNWSCQISTLCLSCYFSLQFQMLV